MDVESIIEQILCGPRRDESIENVGVYFGTTAFTGRYFDSLDDGGDRPDVVDVVTAADIVAVSALSIQWRAITTLELLDERRDQLSRLLAAIPAVAITDPVAPQLLADGGPVDKLWAVLRKVNHVGPTTAGKLISRKRPHLVPVFDQVVNSAIGAPRRYWLWWQGQFADDSIARAAENFRRDVGGIDHVSLLRCLDVAIWMHATGRGKNAPLDEDDTA
jgi:hypothetical protein